MTSKTTKAERDADIANLRSQIQGLQTQIRELTDRRNNLNIELRAENKALKELGQTLGQAKLMDQDLTSESDAWSTQRTKVEAIKKAISQATSQLGDLDDQLDKSKRSLNNLLIRPLR